VPSGMFLQSSRLAELVQPLPILRTEAVYLREIAVSRSSPSDEEDLGQLGWHSSGVTVERNGGFAGCFW
jgi:hypothetical protein